MRPTDFIERYHVRCFYHFTDLRNLASIREQGGLLSLAGLRNRRILIPAPGSDAWSQEADRRSGLDQFVHLCLMQEHPMEFVARQEGRIQESRFIEIDPLLVLDPAVRFTRDVANKRGVQVMTLSEACLSMDFEVIYARLDWRDKSVNERRQRAKKYELLVPGCVPLGLIRGL